LTESLAAHAGVQFVHPLHAGVTKRCRLSLLTNSALHIRVQMREGGGGSCGVSANEYSCAHHVTWYKLWRSTSIFNPYLHVNLMQCWSVERGVRDPVRADERHEADALLHPLHRGDFRLVHLHCLHRRRI
jgi:hypothetical protein